MTTAGALAQSKNADAETRAKVTAMLLECDEITEQAKNAQKLDQWAEETRSAGRPPRGEVGTGNESGQAQRALLSWMRTGAIAAEDRSILHEKRDLGSFTGVGVTTNSITSSVAIPVGMDPLIATATRSYGQLYNSVRHLQTSTGEPQKYVISDDTANSLVTLATEITAVTETDGALSGGISYVDDLSAGLVRVSNNLLNDSSFSISDWLSETFLARYLRGMNQLIEQGNASHIVALRANVPVGATTASPTAIVLNDLVGAFAALDPSHLDSASWVLSPAVKAALMMMVDSYGRPLLQEAGGAPFSSLFGRPLVSSTYAPGIAAGTVPLLFGDLSSYTMREVSGGLTIVRLVERYAEFGETAFLARTRAGSYSTLITSSPAIVSLKMHA